MGFARPGECHWKYCFMHIMRPTRSNVFIKPSNTQPRGSRRGIVGRPYLCPMCRFGPSCINPQRIWQMRHISPGERAVKAACVYPRPWGSGSAGEGLRTPHRRHPLQRTSVPQRWTRWVSVFSGPEVSLVRQPFPRFPASSASKIPLKSPPKRPPPASRCDVCSSVRTQPAQLQLSDPLATMQSWEGENYYTTDPVKWVALMNKSTAEWNVGPLPPNLVALPGSQNQTIIPISTDALVIEYAGTREVGSRDAETIVFGVTSALVLLWAVVWTIWQYCINHTLFTPLGPPPGDTSEGHSGSISLGTLVDGAERVSAAEFERQLFTYYYPAGLTELEVREKDVVLDGGLGGDDVEAATALVRRMLGFDQELWALRNATHLPPAERETLRNKSAAALDELRRVVQTWITAQERLGLRPQEQNELQEIYSLLTSMRTRYGHPQGGRRSGHPLR